MKYIIILSNHCKEILVAGLLLFFIYYLINIGNRYVDTDKRLIIDKKKILTILGLLLAIGVVYSLINNKTLLSEMIILLFCSIIFSYVLNPLVNYLEKKGLNRSLGILLVYGMIITIFIFISLAIFPKLIDEFENLIEIIPVYTDEIYKVFNDFYLKYVGKIERLPRGFNGVVNIFSDNLNKIERGILNALEKNTDLMIRKAMNSFKLLLVPIISFYLIKDKEYFKELLTNIIPEKYKDDILRLSKDIDKSLLNFIRCQIITSIIVGILSVIALLFLNIKFAILIGLTIALFES